MLLSAADTDLPLQLSHYGTSKNVYFPGKKRADKDPGKVGTTVF